MISPGRLLVLRAVAQHGTLSAAARALGCSQPAVAQQIRRLEAETGVSTLTRTGRGVDLTEAGQALVEYAVAIADGLARAELDVSRYIRRADSRVRLAAFSACQATIIAQTVARLRDSRSTVNLDLVTASPTDALTLLADGACDIAVIFDYPGARRPRRPTWLRVRLTHDRVFVALPARHPLATYPQIDLNDLADERWVIGGQCVIDTRHAKGLTPPVGLATDDPSAIYGLVLAGFGIGLVSDLLLTAASGPGVTLRPLGCPHRTVAAIMDGTLANTPTVTATINALKAAATSISHTSRRVSA